MHCLTDVPGHPQGSEQTELSSSVGTFSPHFLLLFCFHITSWDIAVMVSLETINTNKPFLKVLLLGILSQREEN